MIRTGDPSSRRRDALYAAKADRDREASAADRVLGGRCWYRELGGGRADEMMGVRA